MFFIFGFGHRTVKRFGNTDNAPCDRCNNTVSMELLKVRSWFTLFFIPLIPYKTEYIVGCPICRNGINVTKEEFEDILHGDGDHSGGFKSPAPEFSGGAVKPYDKYAGKTETQIAYLKQMEEIEKEREKANK